MRVSENDPRAGETTYYADGHDGPEFVRSDTLITSVRVRTPFGHDIVSVWNRGGGSGELTVKKGDGVLVAAKLLG